MDAALFAHFIAAVFVVPSIWRTSNTLHPDMLSPNDIMIVTFVALITMKWAVYPFLHFIFIELLLLAIG